MHGNPTGAKIVTMNIEKMKAVADVLERMVANEQRIQLCELAGQDIRKNPFSVHDDFSDDADSVYPVDITAAEFGMILEARKRTLTAELRDLGMAHLAAAPAPSKTPALDAAKEKIGGTLEQARASLQDTTDECAAARRTNA